MAQEEPLNYLILLVNLNDGNNWFSGCIKGSPGGPYIECDTIGINTYNNSTSGLKIYPNPFSTNTTFEFYLDTPQYVKFEIYNTFGNLVLNNRIFYSESGIKRFIINRTVMESGIYFFKVHFKETIQSVKLLVR